MLRDRDGISLALMGVVSLRNLAIRVKEQQLTGLDVLSLA